MEQISNDDLVKFMFVRKKGGPDLDNKLIDYDELTIQVSKSLKDEICEKVSQSEDEKNSFVDISKLSGHYFHMIVANWRRICFHNVSSVPELLRSYKATCTLVSMFDGVKHEVQSRLSTPYHFASAKFQIFSMQKWLIMFLNKLEEFLVENHGKPNEPAKDFPDQVYTSYYFYSYSLDHLREIVGRLTLHVSFLPSVYNIFPYS